MDFATLHVQSCAQQFEAKFRRSSHMVTKHLRLSAHRSDVKISCDGHRVIPKIIASTVEVIVRMCGGTLVKLLEWAKQPSFKFYVSGSSQVQLCLHHQTNDKASPENI